MSHPVATTAERRAVLHRIAHAEARMLPPGWDAGMHHQFGTTLTDPRAQAPLLVDVAQANPDPEPCAPGLCDQHNTACAGHCRYRIATHDLGHAPSRPADEPSPLERQPDTQTRALAKWLAVAGIAAGAALIWAGSR